MEPPGNVTELHRVIGVFSYVAEAIPRYAERVAP